MKRYWIILLAIFIAGFFLIPGSALAHTHPGVHAESPFDAPKERKSLHCQLLGHHHSALIFCPHSKQNRSTQPQFKADCGDSPSGVPVQIQGSKTLLHCPTITKISSTVIRYSVAPKPLRLPSSYPDRLEKPPQHA